MLNEVIKQLANQDIHCYGSDQILKFESQMSRYFEREYKRWHGNSKPPEHYGVNSFNGDIAKKSTSAESIDHYNNDLQIFQRFLDSEYMCYTMGYYGATNEHPVVKKNLSLSDAQISKFDLIVERADIQDGQRILELGSGFGGFIKYLLDRFPNIHITAINPCEVQTSYLTNTLLKSRNPSDKDRVALITKFFDDIGPDDLRSAYFDRVVSIGVLEAVTNLDKLFSLISRVLKPGGKTLHHFIVSVDTIPQFLEAERTLMSSYFPGGHIWPHSEPMRHNTHLQFVSSWFINGMNYWKTLDEWHKRFWSSVEELHPDVLSAADIEAWNNYFVLCKAMFSPNLGKSYGIGHYLYAKQKD